MASNHYRPGADRAYMARAAAYRARQNAQPEAIAERARSHRAKAEAHMEWVALGHLEHLALARQEYALAYEEEN